jgi:hypothetical protein
MVDYEHGVLGDYPKWTHNPGWNGYEVAGAVHNGPRHDLYFYLEKDSPHRPALEQIIRKVADPNIPPLQTTLGSRQRRKRKGRQASRPAALPAYEK